MKSTFRILFYVKRDKQKLDGTLPVMCRITVDGQAARFNTKVSVNPMIWDSKAHIAIGRSKEANEINTFLNDIRASIHNVYHQLLIQDNAISAEKVKNTFLGIEVKHHTVLELFRTHNEDFAKLVGINKSILTYKKYELVRQKVSDFISEYYNVSDIPLKEVNHMFLHNLQIYLMTTYDCGENTTAKFIQRFRTIIILAKNNGWIRIDPFANFKIKFKKSDRGYLTQVEIDVMMKKKFASKRLEQVRDIFILCCFTGLSYIDVRNLHQSNIRTSFDGNLWIMGKREKTRISFNIPLLTYPKQIIEKYAGLSKDGKIFPVPSNTVCNDSLKRISNLIDCLKEKKVTFHLRRHTFATLFLSEGVPLESLSKMLGHKNIATTQIYAKILNEKVGKDMQKVSHKFKGMERSFTSQL